MDMELRLLRGVEVRAVEAGDKKQLVGYAAKYAVRSHTIGNKFQEEIRFGAFDNVVRQRPDVVALVNHDTNMPLGRTSSGTLRLKADGIGLAYELDLGSQSYAKDLLVSVKRGDIKGCSFAFQVNKGIDDEWDEEDGMPVRYINNFKALSDISFVTSPAYPETTIDARQELALAEMRSRAAAVSPSNWREHRCWLSCCEYMGIDPKTASLPQLVAKIEQRDQETVARRKQMNDFLLS